MQAVILAAGRGTRLSPLTDDRTKAMLPVAGKPMVERVMETLQAAGFQDFVLVVHPQDHEIRRHFAGRAKMALQPAPLGMAHSLQCAAALVEGDFLLSACDNLTSVSHVQAMCRRWQAAPRPNGLLATLPVEPARRGSVGMVEMDGEQVRGIVEKPDPSQVRSDISSLPLYCFSHRLLDYLPAVPRSTRGEYELQDAIQMLIERQGRVYGVMVDERVTLTNAADLLALNLAFLQSDPPAPPPDLPGVTFSPPVRIEPGADIGPGSQVGPLVYAEAGSRIGPGSVVRRAVLLRGSQVPAEGQVEEQVLSAASRTEGV